MAQGSGLSSRESAPASPQTSGGLLPEGAAEPDFPPASVEDESEGHGLHRHSQQRRRRRIDSSVTYRATGLPSSPPATGFYEVTREETWTCFVVLLAFWSFAASMALILGFYGFANLVLGPNSSRLIDANSLFVQSIKLQSDSDKQGAELYEFSEPPPLDVEIAWSETHNVSVGDGLHKEWGYYLNEGSHVSISYNVNSQASSPLVLVIAQGNIIRKKDNTVLAAEGLFSLLFHIFNASGCGEESLRRWTEEPMFPVSTLSWNLMNGTGLVQQKILKSSDYYIAVGNLNPTPIEVQLDFVIDALLYNTSGALCKCLLLHSSCVMKLSFLQANAAILSTSVIQQNEDGHGLFIKLSYNPRWITYVFGSALMTVMILLALKMLNYLHYNSRNSQAAETAPERAPLLSNKNDDDLSLGSSYDSVSSDENNTEDHLHDLSQYEPGASRRGQESDYCCLCTICLDVARDCFFIPCGHCAVCFACGTRVLEDGGTCPACRRRIKRVKKIFS